MSRLWNLTLKNSIQNQIVSYRGQRTISKTSCLRKEKEPEDKSNPLQRTLDLIGDDFKRLKRIFTSNRRSNDNANKPTNLAPQLQWDMFQTHCDVLVIGGGGIGSSIAYWLKKKARNGLNVVVVEKDCTYKKASANHSFRGLNQYFSLPENIQMAMYGAEFLRDAKQNLGDIKLNYSPYGSLVLASEEEAEILRKNEKIQHEMGVRSELLTKDKLAMRFPWLNTNGVALGWHGLEKEGWFDPMALLLGFKLRAYEYGAYFVEAEVIGFEFQRQEDVLMSGYTGDETYTGLDKAVLRMPDGETRTIKFAICIIASGSSSKNIGKFAKIGTAPGLLSIPLPVERKTKFTYTIDTQNQGVYAFTTPMTIDTSKVIFKHDGLTGRYVCGCNTDLEYQYITEALKQKVFEEHIRPSLSKRINNFKFSKVGGKTISSYEMNTFDENGVVGPHPYYNNLYLAIGFKEHGIQQAAAVGRGISELIIDGRYRSIDLTRLGFDRLIIDRPLRESCVA